MWRVLAATAARCSAVQHSALLDRLTSGAHLQRAAARVRMSSQPAACVPSQNHTRTCSQAQRAGAAKTVRARSPVECSRLHQARPIHAAAIQVPRPHTAFTTGAVLNPACTRAHEWPQRTPSSNHVPAPRPCPPAQFLQQRHQQDTHTHPPHPVPLKASPPPLLPHVRRRRTGQARWRARRGGADPSAALPSVPHVQLRVRRMCSPHTRSPARPSAPSRRAYSLPCSTASRPLSM